MALSAADPTATPAMSAEAKTLTEVVTRLRRALRTSIRTDYPWESLPMAQVELLLALGEHGSVRVGELATLLRLAPNTVSGLVQVLVENGFVTRASDPSDRRVAVVALTAAGRLKLDDWGRAHEQRIGDALDRLAPGDRATVRAALPALAHLVDHLASPDLDAAAADDRTA